MKEFPKYSNIPVYVNVIKLLQEEPEILPLLERIIQWEEEMPKRNQSIADLGFRSEDVFGDPRTLAKLVPRGILYLSYQSNKDRRYKAYDLEELKRAVEDYKKMEFTRDEIIEEIPKDLFRFIVGHDDVKEILYRAIEAEQPIHVLLTGTPASSKSLFLEELTRLPRSKFILGSGLSKAGLYDVIFEEQPRYIIIDEIDKIDSTENLTCLLSLMERGIVVETKHKKQRSIKLKCSVFAGANKVDKLPPELLSRFLLLHFRAYTVDEFREVVVHILTEREKIPAEISFYIVDKCVNELSTRDPRDAVKIARLLKEKSKEEVERVVELIKKRK